MHKPLVIGKFKRPFGIHGWIKLISYADPKEQIFTYQPWLIIQDDQTLELVIESNKQHGQELLVKLKNYDNPEQAAFLTNALIYIDRAQLPKLKTGEYYWSDLEGLVVETTQGQPLGRIDYLFATGSNDVMVIKDGKQKHLVPYLKDVVISIDLDKKIMVVDWEPE